MGQSAKKRAEYTSKPTSKKTSNERRARMKANTEILNKLK